MLRAVTLAAMISFPQTTQAAWIIFINETQETVIVQEIVIVKGKPVAGKPVKLVAGETLRQFQAGPAAKTLQIIETGPLANRVLTEHELNIKDKDLGIAIRSVSGQVKLLEVEAMVVKK